MLRHICGYSSETAKSPVSKARTTRCNWEACVVKHVTVTVSGHNIRVAESVTAVSLQFLVFLTVPCKLSTLLPSVPATEWDECMLVKSVTALVTREYDDTPLWTATSNSFKRDIDGKIILKCILKKCGQDNKVGTGTCYGLDGPGIEPRWGWDYLHLSRPALGSTQPPVQWISGLFLWGKVARAWDWPSNRT